jgi:hypothetical protein
MSLFKKLPYGGGASLALAPVDLSAAAVSTLYANMRDVNDELWLLLFFGVGTAADEAIITLTQATSSAGAGVKALTVKEAWYKRGGPTITNANASTRDVWTKSTLMTREAPTATYITASDRVAATNQFMAAIRILPGDLDHANGFTYVKGAVNDVGANAQLCFGLWVPEGYALAGSNLSLLA